MAMYPNKPSLTNGTDFLPPVSPPMMSLEELQLRQWCVEQAVKSAGGDAVPMIADEIYQWVKKV